MPSIEIEGLEVKFPYEPYQIQKDLMSCVIKCIQNREHGLLESPTGTGKTASLLCSSLAWQQTEKDRVRLTLQRNLTSSDKFIQAQLAANPSADQIGFSVKATVPRIIYATRTHSQISQAVRELKRTQYNRVKTVTLGSRDILCIHDEVSRLPESSTKIMACHMRVIGRTCAYYNNVQKVREQFAMTSIVPGAEPQVMDIEEMVKKGRGQRFCPFFMSKELVADADLIFMPYNYLLDPKLRASHGVDLKGCIIILDEAHNITKVCEDSSSFDLKSSVIAQSLREVTKALNEFNDLTEELVKSSSAVKDLSMGEIVKLKATLLELEKQLDEAPFAQEIPDSGKTVPGQEVLRCFFSAGFTIDQFGRWIRVLDGVSSFLAQNLTEASGCDKFSGVLRVLSTRLLYGQPDLFLGSYTVKVELETRQQTAPGTLPASFTKPKGKVFHFWCLNPAVGLDLLLQHVPRCIMLASGTLSPINFLENELQLHFPIKIQNPHIITESQLYAAVLKVGPGDVKLSSAYNNRSRTEYLVSLGAVISQCCLIVPEGVLVFFPSYAAMDQAVDYWKENGHWGTIAGQKSVYVEPRGKRALDDLITNYYTDTEKGSGSCLMAVCRGKVSEGLDFMDGKCRAVIITGLPYAPYKNEQVTSKMKYLDDKCKQSPQGVKGQHWYGIDAVRALNQAVGRIIRHRNDFGAILLCDDRCDYKDVNQNMSSWVSSRLVRPSFVELKEGLRKFFKSYGIALSSYNNGLSSMNPSNSASTTRPRQNGGSGFQIRNGLAEASQSLRNGGPSIKIDYEPEPEFSKLYDGSDTYESASQQQKSVGKNGKLDFASLQATTKSIVSFTCEASPSAIKKTESSTLFKKGVSSSEPTNPKKRIKLVTDNNRDPTKYTRLVDNPSWLGGTQGTRTDIDNLPKSGVTAHHLKRKEVLEEEGKRRSLFSKPTLLSTSTKKNTVNLPFTSTSHPPSATRASSEHKTFDNVKEYGEWIKGKLTAEKYRKVMGEFKNYKEQKEVLRLLNFGKEIFPDNTTDYKSYTNGLKLVCSALDRSIIDDVMSAYEDLDDDFSQ